MASRARTAEPPTPTRRKPAAKTAPASKPALRTKPEPAAETVVVKQAAPAVTAAISCDAIAERAYYIWLRKGRPFGQDDQNWIEAEAELAGELSGAAG